jgi:hypothetical protein
MYKKKSIALSDVPSQMKIFVFERHQDLNHKVMVEGFSSVHANKSVLVNGVNGALCNSKCHRKINVLTNE